MEGVKTVKTFADSKVLNKIHILFPKYDLGIKTTIFTGECVFKDLNFSGINWLIGGNLSEQSPTF